MDPVEPPVVERGPVDKAFRPFQPDQIFLVPPSLDEWLPQNHLARFIGDLVDEHLDLSAFYADYREGRGAPPFDPRLMVRVLLLGYTTGVRSSRKLEEACWDNVAFRWLAGGEAPAYRAVAKFRKRHLSALGHLFVQALELCQAAGMVSLGKVALDGTKVRANASRRKAMSYARMSEKQKILAAEVSDLLAEAERIDKDEDARFGEDNKGYGLPEELARREGRLAKITKAKAALEAEAAERAAAEAAERARAGKDEDTIAERVAAAADRAVPKPKAQRNFTDPDSRIMKTADGSFAQSLQRPGRRRCRPSGHRRDRPEQLRRRQPDLHPDDGAGQPQHRSGPEAGSGRCRLLLAGEPGSRREAHRADRHPVPDRPGQARPRRTGSTRAARPDPKGRPSSSGWPASSAPKQARPTTPGPRP